MTLRVVALFTALPDKIDEAKQVMTGLVAPTRQEAGCITYDLLQSTTNPAHFSFVEEWQSEADLEAHLKTPHVTAALEKIPELTTGAPDIRRYHQVA